MSVPAHETVSIIIPCLNEEKTIRLLLEAIYRQDYPRELLQVVIADGQSIDRTRAEILRFSQEHPDLSIQVVDNPLRNIPTALNLAIAAASGKIILRLDAHSVPGKDYVALSAADLAAGLGDNVGGVWKIKPGSSSWIGRSIAEAAGHRLGVGDAQYRYATSASLVDTVPFGAFYRGTVERLGGFDEKLLTNEDYEFNSRIRQSGGKVYLDPQIQSQYFSRPNLGALARQYWRYGFWKWRMLQKYPETLRWRQALPPAFVAGTIGVALLAIFWPWARWLVCAELAAYLIVLAIASLPNALKRKIRPWLPGYPWRLPRCTLPGAADF